MAPTVCGIFEFERLYLTGRTSFEVGIDVQIAPPMLIMIFWRASLSDIGAAAMLQ